MFFFIVNIIFLYDYFDNIFFFFEIVVKEMDIYIFFNYFLILILYFMGYFIKCIIFYFLYLIKENFVLLFDILLVYIVCVNFLYLRE